MIKISVTDTDIIYPIKTLTVDNETEGMTLEEKQNFLDKAFGEIKEDLRAMLFGQADVYDDYYDGMNSIDEAEHVA